MFKYKFSLIFIIFSLFFCSCLKYSTTKCRKQYIESVCSLTKKGHYVYVTLNVEGKGKLLLTSAELYPNFIHSNILEDTTTKLYEMLIKQYWQPKQLPDYLDKRFIDMDIYKKISTQSPLNVYNIYFNENGVAKEAEFTEIQIEAAVAFLIDCNTTILGKQINRYVVNSPPIGKCCKFNKKNNL